MPNNVDKRNSSAYTVNNLKAEQVRAIVRKAGVTKVPIKHADKYEGTTGAGTKRK
jgi:hypothetical protein